MHADARGWAGVRHGPSRQTPHILAWGAVLMRRSMSDLRPSACIYSSSALHLSCLLRRMSHGATKGPGCDAQGRTPRTKATETVWPSRTARSPCTVRPARICTAIPPPLWVGGGASVAATCATRNRGAAAVRPDRQHPMRQKHACQAPQRPLAPARHCSATSVVSRRLLRSPVQRDETLPRRRIATHASHTACRSLLCNETRRS